MKNTGGSIKQLLLDKGLVSPEALQLLEVRLELKRENENLPGGDIEDFFNLLVEQGKIRRQDILQTLAQEFQMETITLNDLQASPGALKRVGRDLAERYGVVPLTCDGHCLQLAIGDPFDLDSLDNLSHLLGLAIETKLAWPGEIRQAIERFYAVGADEPSERQAVFTGDNLKIMQAPSLPANISGKDPNLGESEAPINRYVQWLIAKALDLKASDIHLEPLETCFRVRLRIDGSLQEIENPPKRLQSVIISRLKIMADISIAEKRLPQDGRILVSSGSRHIDLRVSTLPTAHGESVVIRILDKANLRLDLSRLGFRPEDLEKVKKFLSLPDGMILVTGPTGSGKTTSLYSFLHSINQPDRKIITVEDPVEYQLSGINQVQVKKDVGLNFASALRSLLRQAPNIIMIGEIRDLETAEIAVHASLTGHLVFSTLHTNDAAAAVSRLVDIGIKPFLVSASLRAILAQRLLRLLCRNCRRPFENTVDGLGVEKAGQIPFTLGPGCSQCFGRGFLGRIGIFEILEIGEEIRQLIYQEAPLAAIRSACRKSGLRALWEEGMRKAAEGYTTVEEVLALTVGAGKDEHSSVFRV